MAEKVLENVNMGCTTWTSYIAAAEGVLRGAGLWDDDVCMLMGMTGMAFHFIVHNKCCASAVTVYDWVNEHSTMMDRIGIHSDVYQVFYDTRLNTFELKRKDAVQRIKESIDNGKGVVVWTPTKILEFGVIKGYDDEDGVFFVGDCTGRQVDPMLYENLGKSDVPILFYQIFKEKIKVDPEKVYWDSLQFAVNEWNKEFHVNPEFASGRKGYAFLEASLSKGDFDTFGLAYILVVYQNSKSCIVKYLDFISENSVKIKGINKAVDLYKKIADKYEAMTALFPFSGGNGTGCNEDRSKAPKVLELIRECRELEEQAMACISESLRGLVT
jgi:hypothetical protein